MSKEWKQVNFSVDLVYLAKCHLDFLKLVDSLSIVDREDIIARAAYRYEVYWMPFYNKLKKTGENPKDFFPPTDVAWIWHCHLLCPTQYAQDCRKLFGYVLPHFLHNHDEIIRKQQATKGLWERNVNESFDYQSENSITDKHNFKNFRSQLAYNLIDASNRQKGFYYQVSLPHFRDDKFLKQCLERYKKFLYLKVINKNDFIVPCYGIDIIWHTHQLCPIEYANDTIRILGYIFPHDDTTNDRSSGSKLVASDRNTRNLWEKAYGENFLFSGGMFRGDKPSKENFTENSKVDIRKFMMKKGTFRLAEISINSKEVLDEKEKFVFKVYRNNVNMYKRVVTIPVMLRFYELNPYTEKDDKSLDIRVSVSQKERLGKKIVNAIESKRIIIQYNFYFKLNIPEKDSETQEFQLNINDSKGRNLVLHQKYQIDSQLEPLVTFGLEKQPFTTVHIKDILSDYSSFDLKNRNLNGRNGEAIRSQHIISTECRSQKIEVYRAEILHIMSLRWSSVKIMMGNKLMATSHLIGLTQLPYKSQVNANLLSHITFDPKTERAMVVRNINGDYAVVKAKWVNFRPPQPYKRFRGAPGHLRVKIYSIENGSVQTIEVTNNFKFSCNGKIESSVDLNQAKIKTKILKSTYDSIDVESDLAVIFSIAVLHVLLQPKPRPYAVQTPTSKGQPTLHPYYQAASRRPAASYNVVTHPFFSSVGYYDLITTACFIDTFCHHNFPHHHHHHHHDHDHNTNNNDNCEHHGHDHDHNHDHNHDDNNNDNSGDNSSTHDTNDNYVNDNNLDYSGGDFSSNDTANNDSSWFDSGSSYVGGDSGNTGDTSGGFSGWDSGNTGDTSGGFSGWDSGNTGDTSGGFSGGTDFGTTSTCGGATSSCGGATSSCGGATSSCGGATSSCGGATSSCGGGGTSSCGGGGSSCGGGGSSCGGSS